MSVNAQVGVDSVVITASSPNQLKAKLAWGTDPADLPNETTWQLGQGAGPYTYSWTVYDLQQAVDTTYESTVFYNDDTFETASWTQPGLNASTDDTVHFRDITHAHWNKLSHMLGVISLRGYSFQAEWAEITELVRLSTELNTITWSDGR
jgi:hypothetical protein